MKNILITGSRSGIAHHVIETLMTGEYHIYASVHTENELKQMTKKYQEELHITCFKLDVTNKEDWKQLDTIDIDIFFSNAAIGYGGSLMNMDIGLVRDNYETNVFSNLELTQYILQKMEKRGQGKIIMMTSLAGIVPIPFLGSYCSSKASLIKWMECLHLELKEAKIPIQLSIIEPGLYRTGFNQVMLENKYPVVEENYFDHILDLIHKQDQLLLLFAKKNMNRIVKKIVTAVESETPKFIYRSPISQTIFAKIYQLFFT